MAKIIAITNQKGGVGKTTTSVNLSACVAQEGHRVLIVDADPQGNTSSGLGIRVKEKTPTVYEVMSGEVPLMDALFEVTSAFGTVGLSTGITPSLGVGAKLLSILIMYIGRLGPLTVASLWYFSRGERISYPEGNLSIG